MTGAHPSVPAAGSAVFAPGDAETDEAAAVGAAPGGAVTVGAAPGGAAPGGAVTGDAAPGGAAPGDAVPDKAAPGDALGEAASGRAALAGAAPEPSVFAGLVAGGWREMAFGPFREGVTMCRLVTGWPELALLRYAAGARVPRHRHTGLETVLVLDGIQSDERGDYPVGTLMVNPEGSEHSVWSDGGCVVLIQWERPVVILDGI